MQRFSFTFLSVFVLAVLALAASGFAQNPSPADRGKETIHIQMQEPGFPGTMFLLQEGGLHNLDGEVAFVSAFGADAEVIKNAPYSATAVTETTQTLADGNRIVNKSSSFYARDGQGRVRREMSMERMGRLPVGGPQMVFISDPSTHTEYILQPNDSTARVIQGNEENGGPARLRHKLDMIVKTRTGSERPPEKIGLQEKADVKHEDLGTQEIAGVSCQGKRETVTIPAGKVGNERPIEIVGESWYSPDLHTVVLRKHSDPRVGETVYRLTDIKTGEPDPALFQIPSGYKSIVKDETFTKE